jgi:SAM-dependent methyltransferase
MASDVIRTGRVTRERCEQAFGPIKRGALVLDVGGGNSPLVGELRDAGHGAIAVDLDYGSRPPRYANSVVGDASFLPFRSSSFDDVYVSYVLMHLTERAQVVEELLFATRPGGRLCITPVWPRRVARNTWEWFPEARLIPGSRYPRRRASLEVRPAAKSPRTDLVEWIAQVSGPPEPIRRLGHRAMSVIVKVFGTPEVEIRRFRLRRVAEHCP